MSDTSATRTTHGQITPTSPVRSHLSRRIPRAVACVLGLAAAAVYTAISLVQWGLMETPSWDLAIFTQALKQYAGLAPPVVNIKGYGFNLLGDHFHPILVLLAPLYALLPSGLTLMVVQDLLLALAVGVFAWYGTRYLGVVRGACLALGFAASFGVLEAIRVQFHEVAFAVPLMALALCSVATGRLRAALLWAAPLVFVKEDLGVTAAMVGVLVVARYIRNGGLGIRSGRMTYRRAIGSPLVVQGIGLIVWGLSWSAAAVFLILPALNPRGHFDYGGSVDVWGALADPLQALGLMLYPWAKSQTLLLLAVTGALVFLRSPVVWVGVPTLVWRFLSDNPGYWEPTWHYNLVLMPVVFAAVFDAALRVRPIRATSVARAVERMTAAGPVLAAGIAVVLVAGSTASPLLSPDQSRSPGSIAAKQEALRRIPQGASVASDLSVLTYLVPDHDVRWIGHRSDPAPDYLVLDRTTGTWNGAGTEELEATAASMYGGRYAALQDDHGVVVLERRR